MKEKIMALLAESAKQYGLSQEFLESLAGTAVLDDESKIPSWIDSIRPILEVSQRQIDSRVSSALKKLQTVQNPPKEVENDVQKLLGELEERLSGKMEEKLKSYSELQGKYDALSKINEEASKKMKEDEYQKTVKRVGASLGLSEKMLGLVSKGLNSGMSEKEIDEAMSSAKSDLVSEGLYEVEGKLADRQEALKKSASDWVSSRSKSES